MSKDKVKQPLTPEDIRKKAKKIIQNNPTYIKDEPPIVGSPESLTEDIEKDDETTNRKRK
ncbi:hypothetical protein [Microbulbifer thermotolerans]|uniref:Uncharacterized protein n=1 Tax=Microbulbifer thermotolerans TaxID=252514 RepID=A0AB35HWG6_MICTH|nr:hypothetical protein [Microbulbifer thermotolerans]MCX2801744.1 hypothetical protein [Microbulbifer thermotolerans]